LLEELAKNGADCPNARDHSRVQLAPGFCRKSSAKS
jgi:hypothetical protein